MHQGFKAHTKQRPNYISLGYHMVQSSSTCEKMQSFDLCTISIVS